MTDYRVVTRRSGGLSEAGSDGRHPRGRRSPGRSYNDPCHTDYCNGLPVVRRTVSADHRY